jgi:hypothetical protein
MRPLAAVALALMLVLAGCSVGFQQGDTPTPDDTTPAQTATSTPTATATPDSTGAATSTATQSPTETATPAPNETMQSDLADPPSDRLGWEDGYWYNETVPVNATDGLNQTELDIVVARSMARVEHIRQLEFQETVPVSVINRSTYRERYVGGSANYTESFRTFDNVKFETLFLIGERQDSLAVQNTNRGSNVLGFYSPANDTIVVVSESAQPVLNDELTLGHELVHALQDQQFDISRYERPTREVYNAYNGLIEGDARSVELRYKERCGAEWDCLSVPSEGSGGGGDLHFGVYILNYFPYSDGPGFVDYHQKRGGWDAVNAIYDAPPASAEQVIHPDLYREDAPTNVSLTDSNAGDWERVRPEPPRPSQLRPAYASFGQSGVVAMFAYTLYDSANRSRVVQPDEFLNLEGGQVNSTDPLNYAIDYADGWDGDRLHIYDTPGEDNETAYVWRSVWDSPAEAKEFAAGYRNLLSHWGGERVGSQNHWEVTKGPFRDAFYIEVEGDTVTIVNAPSASDLGDVYADYEPPSAGN